MEDEEDSHIPIILALDLDHPVPRRSLSESGVRRSRVVILTPTVYNPNAPPTRSQSSQSTRRVSKQLPPIPKSPWPIARQREVIPKSPWPAPRETDEAGSITSPAMSSSTTSPSFVMSPSPIASPTPSYVDSRRRTEPTIMEHEEMYLPSQPKSSMRSNSSDKQSSLFERRAQSNRNRRAASNPASSENTLDSIVRRPTVTIATPRTVSSWKSRAVTPGPSTGVVSPADSTRPLNPPSRQNTASSSRPLLSSGPKTGSSMASKSGSINRPAPIQQSPYINMLLSVDKIPRLHNIFAAFFGWILLAGLVVIPATFTSPNPPGSSHGGNSGGASNDPNVLATVASLPMLIVAAVCIGIGAVGTSWLAVRWRHNYVWLLNRLYLPGTLNGLAGLVSTLVNVYSQHGGMWNVSAQAALGISVGLVVICGFGFAMYNDWLLRKMRNQHALQLQQQRDGGGFMGRIKDMTKQPSFAPGSVV